MPPKKKQEQIDLSTLPQCISSNAILLCKGKKIRSEKILNMLFENYKSFLSKVSRQQVLNHAKQKNIYVDPNSLNQKQKKDPKFMETICTQLSPEIIAKATKSLIQQLSIKIRLQLKAQNQKPEQERSKPLLQKKMDQVFIFPTQFFQSKQQYEALSNAKQGIKYVFIINSVLNWASAPEIPEVQQQDEQEQQEDEQIKQFKQLKKKQQLNEQDREHNQLIQSKIQQIKRFRKDSSLDSSFRDCIIDVIDSDIDPYNEDQSINQIIKSFLTRLSKLTSEYDEFLDWRKDRQKQRIIQEQSQQEDQSHKNETLLNYNVLQGSSTGQILQNFVDGLFSKHQAKEQEDDIQNLINDFNFSQPINQQDQMQNLPGRKDKRPQFYMQNQNIAQNVSARLLQEDLRSKLQYPGLNRYLMPDIPLKSAPLRKLNRSHYVQFLNDNLPYQEFQRRLSLIKFEQILKEVDEERKYSFDQRIYEQYHDQKSLMRQLYRTMSVNQQAHFVTKYNDQNDKLYMALVYKNNQRRAHTKLWESGWKVLPNYQSWLKYFRQNDTNLNNQSFYDIDYEKIGHINDQVNSFSIPDGSIIINKKSTIANSTNQFLYGIKNHHLFGLNNKIFFSQNQNIKLYHFLNNVNQYQTQILIGEHMKIRLQQKTGDIIVESAGQSKRTYTIDGYTIIYQNQDSQRKQYKILHPTGGISSLGCYINQKGLGMKDNSIHNIPTLLRRNGGYEIIKRDDNTVIITDKQRKWIKFYEGTEYLIENNQINIEKKNLPFVKCSAGVIQIQIDELTVKGYKINQNQYSFTIAYADQNQLNINGPEVQVAERLQSIPIIANIHNNQFKIQFGTERLVISNNSFKYFKNGVQYNAAENEDTFAQNQTLPQDHIQPRLFIINSDNTGVEFLSQSQLQYYFAIKENPKYNTISSIPTHKQTQNVHIISKNIQSSEMNPKRINLNLNIDLDIFKSQKYFKEKAIAQKFTVRSLIKHKNLLPEDQKQIQQIKEKSQQFIRRLRKQQNQFGHKLKGDSVIDQLSKDKKIMIQFRKKQLPKVDFQLLKQQAISEWKCKEKQHMTLVAQKEEEDKIRLRLSKRKKSHVQNYPPIVINPKEQNQQTENYSPAGFYTHYFQTNQGKKALAAMPEWVFRPKTAKVQKQLDPQIVTQLNNTMNKTKKQDLQIQDQQRQRYDTVDVNLNPIRQIYIKPSVFTQREIDEERQAFEQQKKAYFYHEKKRKQFDLYGGERKDKIQVKSLMRTQPISQINQKYLITQAPLDKKIKIASMKNKLTSQASSLVQMRKQGPHHTLLKTIDKRNDYNTLLQKRTMMVHADLNDKLQRDILITPVQAQFGFLKEGKSYEVRINIKNQDILAQRLVVKKARNINVKVMMNQMGPIALGMSRKIIIQIKAGSDILGRFTDEFQIVSKHQIYKIPVTAHILTQSQFENEDVRLSPNVKQIQQLLRRKTSGLPPIN